MEHQHQDTEYIGNKELLNYTKIGFLASRHIDVSDVMACYEWASKKQEPGICVVSGFSSKIEKDVLHFLLKAQTPIIIVLARRMYSKLPTEFQEAIYSNRLLIISICDATRQSKSLAFKRNKYVAQLSDKIIFTGVTSASSLYHIWQEYKYKSMTIIGLCK